MIGEELAQERTSPRLASCDRCDAVLPVEELENSNTFLFCKNSTDCLARKNHAVANDARFWKNHAEWLAQQLQRRDEERDQARAAVDLGVSLLLALDAPEAAAELDKQRTWLQKASAAREAGRGDG